MAGLLRRRATLRTTLAATLVAALSAGCTAGTGPQGPDKPSQPATPAASTPGVQFEPWCETQLPDEWATTARPVEYDFYNADETLHARLVQTALPDLDKNWTDRKELEVITPTGVLKPFTITDDWSIGRATFTDNYLVVRTQVRINMAPRWKLWVWDPKQPTAAPKLIREVDTGGEELLFSPMSVHGDKLTWVERGEAEGSRAILIHDLQTGRMTRVKDKVGQGAPKWYGATVVWQDHQGTNPVLNGLTADGKAWTAPPPIAGAASAPMWAVNDKVWAWTNKQYTTVQAWQPDWPMARTIKLFSREPAAIHGVSVAGDFVFISTNDQTWVADITTQSMAVLHEGSSGVTVYPTGQIVLGWPDPDQPKGAPNLQQMWTVSELPHLSGC